MLHQVKKQGNAQCTNACFYVCLHWSMRKNYGWINRPGALQRIPKHTRKQANTHRGVIFQARLWNAALWENTSQSKHNFTRRALVPKPEPTAALLTSPWEEEGRRGSKGERVMRWDQTGHDERNLKKKLDEWAKRKKKRIKWEQEEWKILKEHWLKVRVVKSGGIEGGRRDQGEKRRHLEVENTEQQGNVSPHSALCESSCF